MHSDTQAPDVVRCPKCSSSDVRYSYSQTFWDMILELFSMVTFRCRTCRRRFHKFNSGGDGFEVVHIAGQPGSDDASKV